MNEIVISGYTAEVIVLLAERLGITPEEYVLSFFRRGCNAPQTADEPSAENATDSFCRAVHCT